jgi:hypothetical protein
MLRHSKGHLHNHDEHVNPTQLDYEAYQENMEVVASRETHTNSTKNIQNDNIELNMIDGFQIVGSPNEKLSLAGQVTHIEWLVEAMINMNVNIVTSANE